MPPSRALVDAGEVDRARAIDALARPKDYPTAVESIDPLPGTSCGE